MFLKSDIAGINHAVCTWTEFLLKSMALVPKCRMWEHAQEEHSMLRKHLSLYSAISPNTKSGTAFHDTSSV